MKKKCYQQTTYETCLAVCLMWLTDITPTGRKEITIWKSGWHFNFLIGQINYLVENYNKLIDVCVENKTYCKELINKAHNNIQIRQRKINIKLIDKYLAGGPVIAYLDNYFLQNIVHAPHFIIILSSKADKYVVADPWDGEIKVLAKCKIEIAINSLRLHLKFSPILIVCGSKPQSY
jgi:hypothetical protein